MLNLVVRKVTARLLKVKTAGTNIRRTLLSDDGRTKVPRNLARVKH